MIYFPPGWDNERLWRGIHPDLLKTPEGRRAITRDNPLLFAVIYFPNSLKSPETGGRTSISMFHVALCEEAREWRHAWGPSEYRVATVAPRGAGKSAWLFLILPLWALAHGHRRFLAMFAGTNPQVEKHLSGIVHQLRNNQLLREDYPELCSPRSSTKVQYISDGGHYITAYGIDSASLGLKLDDTRPDLIIIDDVEPTGSRYSPKQKRARLSTIVDAIFAMNLNAVVRIVGTVTRYGSIMHEVVRAASGDFIEDWITEENIQTQYFPAIVRHPETGEEMSIWPERWEYEWMVKQRNTGMFQLNYMNAPTSSVSGQFWTRANFKYDLWYTTGEKILAIDPATTAGEDSDSTGVALIGFHPSRHYAHVYWAIGVKHGPKGMRDLLRWAFEANPDISTVVIETNNGGDYIQAAYEPVIPRRVKVACVHEQESKFDRIQQLYAWYELGWISHGSAEGVRTLEEQMLSYPEVEHDDILDAVAKGAAYYLRKRPIGRAL